MPTQDSSPVEKLAEQLEAMANEVETSTKTASESHTELDPTHTLNFLKFFTSRQ